MADSLQTTFSITISWKQIVVLWSKIIKAHSLGIDRQYIIIVSVIVAPKQVRSHYLNLLWSRSVKLYGINRPQSAYRPLGKVLHPLNISFVIHFYTPVWKTDVLCRGNVRPSVCLSVRLSIRPRFPDFSSTCFEISIWNLVYTFSRWHDMSSLSCVTIGSLWPSLQPKVGQTHFLQSWPHKSR